MEAAALASAGLVSSRGLEHSNCSLSLSVSTEVQTAFVELLIVLSRLITEGEDVTNEEIWEIIDIIIHRV